ncbi:MAG: 30S ribosomal protein S20 [Gammaproteobacteria bacterium]|nr:MAG: 30S ribosomal protein S20 [Gammaproteobacteria bacterium]
MANSAQARKRARQAEGRRKQNASQLSRMRTAIKTVLNSISGGDKDDAQKAYSSAVSLLDKAVGKNLIHKNNASRRKSRLNKAIRNMA